jgi:hypothetical protein
VDVGKFRLEGAVRRKCLSGQWMGLSSKCEGLSQVHDYAREFPLSVTLQKTVIDNDLTKLLKPYS